MHDGMWLDTMHTWSSPQDSPKEMHGSMHVPLTELEQINCSLQCVLLLQPEIDSITERKVQIQV